MKKKENFVWILDGLIEDAYEDYLKTGEYKDLQAQQERMEQECRERFDREQRRFIFSCFDQLNNIAAKQELYLYYHGMRDCVQLMKWLGVIV